MTLYALGKDQVLNTTAMALKLAHAWRKRGFTAEQAASARHNPEARRLAYELVCEDIPGEADKRDADYVPSESTWSVLVLLLTELERGDMR